MHDLESSDWEKPGALSNPMTVQMQRRIGHGHVCTVCPQCGSVCVLSNSLTRQMQLYKRDIQRVCPRVSLFSRVPILGLPQHVHNLSFWKYLQIILVKIDLTLFGRRYQAFE